MKHITILILISISFLSPYSCKKQTKGASDSKSDEIIILHTNDMHANLSNFPRLAFIVDSLGDLYSDVYLFSAGDIFSGNPIVDMHTDKGFPIIDLMNKVGYDLSALGNHEFDYGQDFLNTRIQQAEFPFVCANLTSETGGFASLAPYVTLLTSKNDKITVLGIIENFGANNLPATHPLKVEGLSFESPFEAAKRYKHLADESDVFIALSHIGTRADKILAEQMPEFDVIIGGHSHTVVDSLKLINDVLLTMAGSKLRYVGEIKLKLEEGQIVEKSYKLIRLSDEGSIDPDILQSVEVYNDNPIFKEVIGAAAVSLNGTEELGSFFTDGLAHRSEIDIAFQNDGGIRVGSIPAGDITMFTIFELDPFGNTLLSLEMTTDEIRSLISGSFNSGKVGLRVSGLKYTVVTEAGEIVNIKLKDYDGKDLDETKTYKVGISDYIYTAHTFDHQYEPLSLGLTTAEALINYLRDVKTINYKGVQRTFVEGN